MTFPRLAWVYLRVGIMHELAYRSQVIVQLFQSTLSLVFALGGLGIVFRHTDRLGGWRHSELLAVVGVYFLVGGAMRTVVQPSVERLIEDVRRGTFDFTLVQPVDAQALVSVQQVQVWKLVDIALGLALIGAAIAQVGRISAVSLLGFVIALAAGGAMIYSVVLMLATLAFWVVRIDNVLVIFQATWETGRWPVGIYPPWLRYLLTFLVPVAFATTVPAEAVTGRLSFPTLIVSVLLAAGLSTLARWFWKAGIRHYSGASA